MKRTILYFILFAGLNMLGELIFHLFIRNSITSSNFINYIIILIFAAFYYALNLSGSKLLSLFLVPLFYLLCSLSLMLLGFLINGKEEINGLLYILTSMICSLFELFNFLIGKIKDNMTRQVLFYTFNTVGISILLLSISHLSNYLNKKFHSFRITD
jgi:hypothetical protein